MVYCELQTVYTSSILVVASSLNFKHLDRFTRLVYGASLNLGTWVEAEGALRPSMGGNIGTGPPFELSSRASHSLAGLTTVG